MKKYAVYPRNVISKNDGKVHCIGFHQLCRLYKVDPGLCVDMSDPARNKGYDIAKLIPLRVSNSGNYELHE